MVFFKVIWIWNHFQGLLVDQSSSNMLWESLTWANEEGWVCVPWVSIPGQHLNTFLLAFFDPSETAITTVSMKEFSYHLFSNTTCKKNPLKPILCESWDLETGSWNFVFPSGEAVIRNAYVPSTHDCDCWELGWHEGLCNATHKMLSAGEAGVTYNSWSIVSYMAVSEGKPKRHPIYLSTCSFAFNWN